VTIAVLVLALGPGGGCSEPTSVSPGESLKAKGGGTTSTTAPAVSSVDPTYGQQGETNKKVRVIGSGFDVNSQVEFALDGVSDSYKVRTNSTRFISPTELEADITISSDATLDLYDVVVTSVGGKKGIGTEMFEVTAATSIGTLGGNTAAEGVNGAGEVVGFSLASGGTQHAFYWSATTEMLDLGAGHAWAIDEAGLTIAGNAQGHAVLWTKSNGAWSAPTPKVTLGAIWRVFAIVE
jgi:probable HAF family extracellular repeat protein